MASYTIFMAEKGSNIPVWSFTTDNIELLAGMLSASVGIMDDLNHETKYEVAENQHTYNIPARTKEYYIDSDADVSDFRLVFEVTEDEVEPNSNGRLFEGQYGIWLKGSRRFHYSLYTFQTNSFFQGIVSICNTFQVDFRDYIYGLAFDGYGNQYTLNDYVMVPYWIGQDAPDIDDIEEEEIDDENITEPLARTDDIVVSTDESLVIDT